MTPSPSSKSTVHLPQGPRLRADRFGSFHASNHLGIRLVYPTRGSGPGEVRAPGRRKCPSFFTDGSGQRGKCDSSQMATWAILSAATGNSQVKSEVLQNGAIPQSLKIVLTSEATKGQTIDRAEFEAVVTALESCPSSHCYTDSQYVCDTRRLTGDTIRLGRLHAPACFGQR